MPRGRIHRPTTVPLPKVRESGREDDAARWHSLTATHRWRYLWRAPRHLYCEARACTHREGPPRPSPASPENAPEEDSSSHRRPLPRAALRWRGADIRLCARTKYRPPVPGCSAHVLLLRGPPETLPHQLQATLCLAFGRYRGEHRDRQLHHLGARYHRLGHRLPSPGWLSGRCTSFLRGTDAWGHRCESRMANAHP